MLAGGGCAIEHDGVRFDTVAPVIVPAAEAVPLLPTRLQRMDLLFGVDSYLRLNVSPIEKPAKKAG